MTLRPILLDTCAAIFLADGSLSQEAIAALDEASAAGVAVYLSPMSAWEVGMLTARNRIALSIPPEDWIDAFISEGVDYAEMSPATLIASSFLPGDAPRDPADRIIAATARRNGYRLMTRDGPLLAYAEAGHLQAVAC